MGENKANWIFVLKNGDTFSTVALFKDACTAFAQQHSIKDLVAVIKGG